MLTTASDRDQLDASAPPEIKAPYFDDALDAWILTRYADVLSAFRSQYLAPTGVTEKASEPSPNIDLAQMRAETRKALSPAKLREWRGQLSSSADVLSANLPTCLAVNLVESYARPLCLGLAAIVTGTDMRDAERLRKIAEPVSAAAADPYDPTLKAKAGTSTAKLRECFHSGPDPLRDSGFVAIAHTLPCLLANAWYALLENPRQWAVLHREPSLVEQAMEEMLRLAGMPRVLFRKATCNLELNGTSIRKRDRIVLQIDAANLDPHQFRCPHELDVRRRGTRHLALGAGPHACVGANLIRMASVAITRPLLATFNAATLARPVEWKGGAVFRWPASLWVFLKNSPNARPAIARGEIAVCCPAKSLRAGAAQHRSHRPGENPHIE